MQVLQSSKKDDVRLAVVCCLHGDEQYGLTVFDYFKTRLDQYHGLKVILANEPAIKRNVRFIESDLNRSFPGSLAGKHESSLAASLLRELKNVPVVLDIHTSTSDMKMVPFVTRFNSCIRTIIEHTDSDKVVIINRSLGKKSMIGNVSVGVSLEYGDVYTQRLGTLRQTIKTVEAILSGTKSTKRKRDVYYVTGVIPKTTVIPDQAENFKFIPALKVYPVLLHEAAYTDIHALAASKKETISL